uniref:Uncharacterized protein n=1 Tax=Arion vulgaris TaxID=1028688 RepID=A0A0B7A9W4_9EUPU
MLHTSRQMTNWQIFCLFISFLDKIDAEAQGEKLVPSHYKLAKGNSTEATFTQ